MGRVRKRKNGEGSYGEKTINGILYQYYRDSNGKYTYARTSGELTKKLRKKKEEEKAKENAIISPTEDNNLYTFSQYCWYWLKIKRDTSDITDGTYDDYESIIENRIDKFNKYDIGTKQLKSLTVDMFNNYFNALGTKYSRGSIDKVWTVIRQVLTYGIEENHIPKILISRIKLPKERDVAVKKKNVPFITEEDMELLYKESLRLTSRKTSYYGNAAKVIIFIMYSGLRISEAIGLKWKHVANDFSSITVAESSRMIIERDSDGNAILGVDGKKKHIRIQKDPKSKDGTRAIPLPERATEILKYFSEIPHTSEDNVFRTNNGTVFIKRNLERVLHAMLNHSNCTNKNYTPHSLRHGYGSVLLSNGVDIKIISELLGHADITTTYNIYIGILKKDKINAIQNVFNKKEEPK